MNKGRLSCKSIAAAITQCGRDSAMETTKIVEREFGGKVIYGDTDSVMVTIDIPGLSIDADLSTRIKAYCDFFTNVAASITARFPPPMKLTFEKMMINYVLVKKKHYAGDKRESVKDKPTLMIKGLAAVKRDKCPLARDICTTMLKRIVIDTDIKGAMQYLQHALNQIVSGNVDIKEFVITTKLSGYQPKQNGHKPNVVTHLAQRMLAKDPGSAPSVGSRVPYVIASKPGRLPHECGETVATLIAEKTIHLDLEYYLRTQIQNPVVSFMSVITPDITTVQRMFDRALGDAFALMNNNSRINFQTLV